MDLAEALVHANAHEFRPMPGIDALLAAMPKGGSRKKYSPSVRSMIPLITTQDEYDRVLKKVCELTPTASNKTLKQWMKALALKAVELRS
jgi:hypothetical protein